MSDPHERMATALELIAQRMEDPNCALQSRISTLQSLLMDFVELMGNPHSTDEHWAALLEEVQQALSESV